MIGSLRVAVVLSVLLMATGGRAETVAEALSRHLTQGAIAEGERQLAARAEREPDDPHARLALGMVQFAGAIERLGRSLHRYGLVAPPTLLVPILRMPVPVNPRPERLDYGRMRGIYEGFLTDLARVDRTLMSLPPGDVKLPIDLNAVRLDLNGDGRADADETLAAIMAAVWGPAARVARGALPAADESWMVAFDRADAIWLRGYARLMSAFVEFVLAHDWRQTYDATAHLFFTGAIDPNAALHAPVAPSPLFGSDGGRFADMLALVHLARWPVAEPRRMQQVRVHLQAVVTLSRESWREILAETDDDREWVPSPRQQSRAVTALPVTQAQVDGWLDALDEFEAVLDGRKLVPHFRFDRGIDLRRVFDEPRPFDLVLWMTGHAAVPYLRDGEVVSWRTWQQWQQIFGGNFMGYAFWFN